MGSDPRCQPNRIGPSNVADRPLAMIVEDHPDVSFLISAALQDAGFETQAIREGNTAMEQLNEVAPALVVTDLSLPNVSGGEIVRRIRADARLADTRVIVLSGEPQWSKTVEALADLVLIKPVSFDHLSRLAARLCPPRSQPQPAAPLLPTTSGVSER